MLAFWQQLDGGAAEEEWRVNHHQKWNSCGEIFSNKVMTNHTLPKLNITQDRNQKAAEDNLLLKLVLR